MKICYLHVKYLFVMYETSGWKCQSFWFLQQIGFWCVGYRQRRRLSSCNEKSTYRKKMLRRNKKLSIGKCWVKLDSHLFMRHGQLQKMYLDSMLIKEIDLLMIFQEDGKEVQLSQVTIPPDATRILLPRGHWTRLGIGQVIYTLNINI